MDDFEIRSLHFTSKKEAIEALKRVDVDPDGVQSMLPKMLHLNIALGGLECRVANIIKQEMLALGGDAAVARGAVGCSVPRSDVILMGTLKQMRRFSENISSQPFGLRKISGEISEILKNSSLDSFPLRTSRRQMSLGEKTLIMGIINVTPDSFSDGGRYSSSDAAVDEGLRMAEAGADFLDVGGESTRPGSDPVSPEEEMRRVIPVIQGLASQIDLPISVDTMKAAVARQALAEGAEIVNDVSAMGYDDQMAGIVAETNAAVVLMHMKGMPKSMQAGDLSYRCLLGEIISFLKKRIEQAADAGIDPAQVMVDPGIGFGKTGQDNMRLVSHLSEFKSLGRPILVGASRKAFIGRITGGVPSERDEGTAAVVTAAILNGAQVIRVHDVAMMKKVATMADALLRA